MRYFSLLLLFTSVFAIDIQKELNISVHKAELASMAVKYTTMKDEIDRHRKNNASAELIDKCIEQCSKIVFENKENLKIIIAIFGWPKISEFGHDAASHAWLIIQNTSDLSFQKYCLNLLKNAWSVGEAQGKYYAYLYDRIAVREDRPQKYGTQLDSCLRLYPIEDISKINLRRKEVGLEDLNDYLSRSYRRLI